MTITKLFNERGICPTLLAQCSSDGDSWYDTGSSSDSSSDSAEQTEITLDERTGLWTGND